jgi:two-component system CheB/CheR fusion protein
MIDNKVRSIVNSLSKVEEDNFFESILFGLSNAIDADYVFIAELSKEHSSASTHTVVGHNQVIDNFKYALKGTPCEITQSGVCCVHPSGIQPLYPDDLLLIDMGIEGYVGVPLKDNKGEINHILVALFEEQVESVIEVESLFLLFSGMILKELEKQSVIEKLKITNQIIKDSNEAIMITNKDTEIIYVNNSFSNITGYESSEVLGKKANILNSGTHDSVFYESMWEQINDLGYWSGEIHNLKKGGQSFISSLTINAIHNEDNGEIQFAGFFSDITLDKAKDRELFQKTHYDSLTGLANRYYLKERLTQTISQAKTSRSDFYLLYIGIDHFKDINDYYGFSVGDQILTHVGALIKSIIRKSDVLARVGGDQFALLVSDVNEQYLIQNFLERTYRLFASPIKIESQEHRINMSIGIAKYPDDSESTEELIKKSEQALYNAKESRRNSFVFYTDEIQSKVIKRIAFKNALKVAVEKKQIEVSYQPIIDLNTNTICKFEALARWQHDGQFVSPEEFIQIAEEFGLIYDLGMIVLEKACRTLGEIKALGLGHISINVNRSIKEFETKDCSENWQEILASHSLQGKDINFELTESILAPDQKSNLQKLARLQEAGSRISLDDFGTGFSSLSYIRNFPIDELKIDRSFIMHMDRDEEDKVLVKTIIAMAKSLGIDTVAEGIETEEHQKELQELGCNYGQGYFISKPLSQENLISFLKQK